MTRQDPPAHDCIHQPVAMGNRIDLFWAECTGCGASVGKTIGRRGHVGGCFSNRNKALTAWEERYPATEPPAPLETAHPPAVAAASRDPRSEPVAGDVLTNGRNTFYVTDVVNGEVFYTEDQPPVPIECVPLDEWRRNAEKDQVLTVGSTP